MRRHSELLFAAFWPTLFIAVIGYAVTTAAEFLLSNPVMSLLEGWHVLVPGWHTSHDHAVLIACLAVAVPPWIWLASRFYRNAYRTEAALDRESRSDGA